MSSTVLITGVAGGIGSATAKVFRREGWQVVGVDKQSLGSESSNVDWFVQSDVSQEAGWQQIYEEVNQKVGRLDGLVNNAAIQICKPLLETTPEEWDSVMAVNVRSAYLGVRQMYPFLQAAEGAIVNVSSVHAVATSANIGAYAASKGAMLALTRSLAIELAPAVRVNAVLPGAVDTEMLRAGLDRGHLPGEDMDELIQELGKKHLGKRIGNPKEIGDAIYFLTDSCKSSFITGQSFVIDGGATAKLSTE
jgi:NAD(P)-dependent dehydrogenase (short-subunit alcohol dehydrogenase family)